MATALMNLEKICEPVFGITSRRYRQLEKDNIVPKIANGEIDFPRAVKMLLDYYRKLAEGQGSLSLTDERVRLTKINADRKMLQLKREEGKLWDAEVVSLLIGGLLRVMNSKLSAIPVKLAPLARATASDMEAKEIIDKFISEVKAEIADTKLKEIFDEIERVVGNKPTLKHVKAAPKAKRVRVGRQRKGAKPGK
jgi:hypothetical protein